MIDTMDGYSGARSQAGMQAQSAAACASLGGTTDAKMMDRLIERARDISAGLSDVSDRLNAALERLEGPMAEGVDNAQNTPEPVGHLGKLDAVQDRQGDRLNEVMELLTRLERLV